MRRIAVIGSGPGSGKTTFSRRLAAQMGLPCIELDALHWGPRWSALDAEAFGARVRREVERDGWVTDGNYGKLGELIYETADTVVWLDIPLRLALWRILTRTLRRIQTGEELWPGTGNRETIQNAFFSRDSLLLFTLRTFRGRRRRWETKFASGRYPHLTVHRFRSNAEADRWLASLGNEERAAPKSGPLSETSGGAD